MKTSDLPYAFLQMTTLYIGLDSRTRGHEVALVKDQCRLDVRKYSFSQRTINEWNRLPVVLEQTA